MNSLKALVQAYLDHLFGDKRAISNIELSLHKNQIIFTKFHVVSEERLKQLLKTHNLIYTRSPNQMLLRMSVTVASCSDKTRPDILFAAHLGMGHTWFNIGEPSDDEFRELSYSIKLVEEADRQALLKKILKALSDSSRVTDRFLVKTYQIWQTNN